MNPGCDHSSYKDVTTAPTRMCSVVDLRIFMLINPWHLYSFAILRGLGHRTKRAGTTPRVALFCWLRDKELLLHCSPSPPELWLHLPQTQDGVALNDLAVAGVFGELEPPWNTVGKSRMLPAWM